MGRSRDATRARYKKRNALERVGKGRVKRLGPETKEAISAAFAQPDFEHARGVNHLQRVVLRLDPVMVDVAERFAAELMDRPDDNNKKRENNRRLPSTTSPRHAHWDASHSG